MQKQNLVAVAGEVIRLSAIEGASGPLVPGRRIKIGASVGLLSKISYVIARPELWNFTECVPANAAELAARNRLLQPIVSTLPFQTP